MAQKEAPDSTGAMTLVTAGTWEVDTGYWPTLMVADEDSDAWERDIVLLAHPAPLPEEEARSKAESDRLLVGSQPGLEARTEAARQLGYQPLDELEEG